MSLGGQIPVGLGALEWRCHVCGKVRPDAEVGVISREAEIAPGVPMRQNLRYCLVDDACVEAAQNWASVKPVPLNWREPLP